MLESLTLNSSCHLLAVPLEIRQIIYSILFNPSNPLPITASPPPELIEDENETTSWPSDKESFAIAPHNLHAQVLSTCRQIYKEGLSYLYSQRQFDLTARESLKLLLQNVGPDTFSTIHHIVLDWDALQDFAWSMPKPGYAEALSGLHTIEMATWRNRHVDTTGTRWRNVKGYERMICQAAADIIRKHPNLHILVEEQFKRRSSVIVPVPTEKTSDEGTQERQANTEVGPRRVKWRFLAHDTDRRDDEMVIEIEKDLVVLMATKDEASDGGFHLPMIDPF